MVRAALAYVVLYAGYLIGRRVERDAQAAWPSGPG